MAAQYDPSDGVSQLSELMRGDPLDDVPPSPPVDPVIRRRRRRRGWLITAIVFVVVFGLGGGYVGWALNASVGMPTAATELRDPRPGAADCSA